MNHPSPPPTTNKTFLKGESTQSIHRVGAASSSCESVTMEQLRSDYWGTLQTLVYGKRNITYRKLNEKLEETMHVKAVKSAIQRALPIISQELDDQLSELALDRDHSIK